MSLNSGLYTFVVDRVLSSVKARDEKGCQPISIFHGVGIFGHITAVVLDFLRQTFFGTLVGFSVD